MIGNLPCQFQKFPQKYTENFASKSFTSLPFKRKPVPRLSADYLLVAFRLDPTFNGIESEITIQYVRKKLSRTRDFNIFRAARRVIYFAAICNPKGQKKEEQYQSKVPTNQSSSGINLCYLFCLVFVVDRFVIVFLSSGRRHENAKWVRQFRTPARKQPTCEGFYAAKQPKSPLSST